MKPRKITSKKVNRSSSGKNNLDRRVTKPSNKTGKTSEGNIEKK